MKNNSVQLITTILVFTIIFVFYACATPQNIADKSGAQLWAENCQRCHNTPPPDAYKDMQWDVATTHMGTKMALTEDEEKKIVEFLKSAN